MVDPLLLKLQQDIASILPENSDLPLPAYLSYMKLLGEWNTAYNLTSVTGMQQMLTYHVLDSLSVLPHIEAELPAGGRCLDVGTGAGLPGIILALAQPNTEWVALDANRKKARFLRHVVLTLGLDNVEVVCSRIEHYVSPSMFAGIVCRAVSSLSVFFNCASRLLAGGASLWAMKGGDIDAEMHDLQQILAAQDTPFSTRQIALQVPGISSPRCLVQIKS
jgi:16S rRNA (guanine527-N7)-methyltransferase